MNSNSSTADLRREVVRDLIRRKRCRDSLHSFALNIDIPTAPKGAMEPDEDIMGPAEWLMPKHHAAILTACQQAITTPFGRALIMAPPGSAKSTYVDVVAAPWALGREPGTRIILTSYASTLAYRQSRRAKQVANSQLYKNLVAAWHPRRPSFEIIKDSDPEWTTSYGSELLAAGLTAGITGNRANGAIIDDPVAGREEADSPAMRKKILDAYQDDLLTRLLPGAWLILIMTRWNEQDLAGEILPLDYKGQSGLIECRDGLKWNVVNLPAKAEHADDPLGRKPGEYIWPEYYPTRHWQVFENGVGPTRQRTWTSLYQQRPAPQGSGNVTREMFNWYDGGQLPTNLRKILASDWAVTAGKNDFTEHGMWGTDTDDNLWAIDWWYEQSDTGRGISSWLEMIVRHQCRLAFNEGGVIDKAIRPAINAAIRDWNSSEKNVLKALVDLRSLPSMQDKTAKRQSFLARAAIGKVWLPRNAPWAERLVTQLLAGEAARHDDAGDVAGLVGRALDQYAPPHATREERKEGLKPFTAAWLEYQEPTKPKVRYK